MPLFDAPFLCPAVSHEGQACGDHMDVFGDHAPCCHHGTSLVFRHNNVRDILGHSARAAGLSAVVIEKKNQIVGSRVKPGDISVQQYHRGFATSAFDVTITHPLQKQFLEIAMDEQEWWPKKLMTESCRSLSRCAKKRAFTLCRWLGSRRVERLRRCMRLFASGPSSKVLEEVTLRI
jgi:hypothetical protein